MANHSTTDVRVSQPPLKTTGSRSFWRHSSNTSCWEEGDFASRQEVDRRLFAESLEDRLG